MLCENNLIKDYAYLLPAFKPLYEIIDEATYTMLLLDPREKTGLSRQFPDTAFMRNLEKLRIKECTYACCLNIQYARMVNVFEYGRDAAVALRTVLKLPRRERDCRKLMRRINRIIPRIYTARDAISALKELEEKVSKQAAKSKEHEHAVNMLYTLNINLGLIVNALYILDNKKAIYETVLTTYKQTELYSSEPWFRMLSHRLHEAMERENSVDCTAFDGILLYVKDELFDVVTKAHQEDFYETFKKRHPKPEEQNTEVNKEDTNENAG